MISPVRFTEKQIDFIEHLLSEFSEYFEEESEDLYNTINDYKKDDKDYVV